MQEYVLFVRLFVVQRNFLGQTSVSGGEGFPTFRDLIPSPFSGCAGGLVAPQLITKCPTLPVGHLVISFGVTKPPAYPENGTELGPETSEKLRTLTQLSA